MTPPDLAAVERENECRATWWRGCFWEGRYDESAPSDETVRIAGNWWGYTTSERTAFLRNSTSTTYVRDVCRTCGATKERTP